MASHGSRAAASMLPACRSVQSRTWLVAVAGSSRNSAIPARARPGSRRTWPAVARTSAHRRHKLRDSRDARVRARSTVGAAARRPPCPVRVRAGESGVPGRHRSMSRAVAAPKSCAARSRTAPFPAQARSPSASCAASACGQPILSTSARGVPGRCDPGGLAARLKRLAHPEGPHLEHLAQRRGQRGRQPALPSLGLSRCHQVPRQDQPVPPCPSSPPYVGLAQRIRSHVRGNQHLPGRIRASGLFRGAQVHKNHPEAQITKIFFGRTYRSAHW